MFAKAFSCGAFNDLDKCLWCSYFSLEEDYKVQTCCVPVDFSVGKDAYNTIRQSIDDKEIGVLGKALLFFRGTNVD